MHAAVPYCQLHWGTGGTGCLRHDTAQAIQSMIDISKGSTGTYTQWIDVRDDAMQLREVQHV